MSNDVQPLNEARSVRNNNPGNLRAADAETQKTLIQPGYVLDKAVGFDKDGFAIFPDKETGLSAMQRQIKIDASRGMTGAQMINKYAPRDDKTPLGQKFPNDPDAYINNVFGSTGIDPNKPIDPKDIDAIQIAMVRQEGGEAALSHFYGKSDGVTKTASTSDAAKITPLAATPVVAAAAAGTTRGLLNRNSGGSDADDVDVGTFGQYRNKYPLFSNSILSPRNKLYTALEARAERQRQRAEEKQSREQKIAQYRAGRVRLANKKPAENTIGFKNFRKKIYEQIIINDEKENQE
jgi:hypothetical protein